MGFTFNRKQCIRSLCKIGFYKSGSGRGNHDKYISPLKDCNPPFIMVPRHSDIHCQDKIIRDLRMMGGDEMVTNFVSNL